ncbi:uncharacterized protein LOC136085893 [Hydra vulgaris]|uniref:uncharacterized protein LOC136085893 n=1 Tax=Hydra vulgaris TaxID=6087 RepID=UPI0032EA75CC
MTDSNKYNQESNFNEKVELERQINGRASYKKATIESIETIKRMVANKEKNVDISQATGLSLRTVQNCVMKLSNNPDAKPKKRGPVAKINTDRRREIELFVSANNSLTAMDMGELISEENKCSTTTIKRELKNMGYTRKRLKPIVAARNSAMVIGQRFLYCTHVSSINDNNIIFIDEIGFNLHQSRHHGYALSGSTPCITVPTQRGRNISLICAISVEGIISFQMKVGSFDAVSTKEWIENSLIPALNNRRYVIIMDNARFHHSAIVTSAIQNGICVVHFLPPYSSQLNPIEELFGVIKNRYNRIIPRPATTGDMEMEISNILLTSRNESLQGFYTHMREWVVRGIQRNEFI